MHIWTPEQRSYMAGIIPGRPRAEIADMVNERFGTDITPAQVKSYLSNHGLSTGLTGHFEKGHIPANKGTKGMTGQNKTSFRPGNVPSNIRPVESERMTKGYVWIKVRDDMPEGGDWRDLWKMKHHVIWEQANGSIPEDHLVVFINGDRMDVRLDNLMLVTKSQHALMNRYGIRGCSQDSMKTGTLIADVKSKAFRREKLEFGHLRELGANPDDRRHGTSTGYQYGCRCDRCCAANREYQLNARIRRRSMRKETA